MQWHGIEEQRVVNSGLPGDRARSRACRSSAPTTCTTCAKPTRIRTTSCCASAPARRSAIRSACATTRKQFFLKTAERDGARRSRIIPTRSRTRCASPSAATSTLAEGENYLPNFDVPARLHARRLLRARRRARASRSGCRGCSSWRPPGALRHTIDEYERRLVVRDRHDQADEVPGYFLIVWDFIRYAREQGIPVGPGRGSAAGSLVAYCLRITDVDPLDFDLIFERFLNPERVSLPDIDIDFCERRRGEVIEYVTRKYGRENVAQIITFGTMKAKAVVRDVGRVLEMPFADVDKVAKQIPAALDMTLDKALEESEPLRQMEQNDPKVKELLERRAGASRA